MAKRMLPLSPDKMEALLQAKQLRRMHIEFPRATEGVKCQHLEITAPGLCCSDGG